ncbi:hypothetical protein GRF59_10385 [Paenibacillus sp. HJL G12]|uniref:Uncharacterized protein n=1 Tax=Paenibacillus dendrobii TaxID=2691084 RepID=A0A7X3IIM2_9BACL|nr:hypothetical protein [Paenibacillus dendrobii]MWV44041.1 hypothetical protein [Paenibacillus dendrobii]
MGENPSGVVSCLLLAGLLGGGLDALHLATVVKRNFDDFPHFELGQVNTVTNKEFIAHFAYDILGCVSYKKLHTLYL